ncbi:MAG: hypothetical protein V1859_00025 [archaeon]
MVKVLMIIGNEVSLKDAIYIVIMGIIVDLDIIISLIKREPLLMHHLLPTHTPLFGFIMSLLSLLIFPYYIVFFGFFSFLGHLLLDYFPYLINKKTAHLVSYIAWTYPFDNNRKNVISRLRNGEGRGFNSYMVLVELIIIAIAVLIFYYF